MVIWCSCIAGWMYSTVIVACLENWVTEVEEIVLGEASGIGT